MKHTYKDGTCLTQKKIDMIIDSIPEDRLDDVMNAWNEFTPFICLCWRQILGYIISAIPEAAEDDVSYIVEQLIIGPESKDSRWSGDMDAKDILDFYRNVEGEESAARLRVIMSKKMHCPDLYKETQNWLELMAIHEIVSELPADANTNLFAEVNLWCDSHKEELAG